MLDAHISGRRIATAHRKRGHDVRAADEERDLDGMTDEALLELAAGDGRVMGREAPQIGIGGSYVAAQSRTLWASLRSRRSS